MSPEVTWTRKLKLPPKSFDRRTQFDSSIVHYDNEGYTGQDSSIQSTTSFRTHGDQSHLDVPDTPLELLRKSTQDFQDQSFALAHPVDNPRGYAGRDTGHPFSTFKKSIVLSHPMTTIRGSGNGYYRGSLRLPMATQFPTIPDIDLVYGTKAIAATIPTNSVANISNDAAEIFREGLPHAILGTLQNRTSYFRDLQRDIGKEYLNIEFGWKPFIRSIQQVLNAVVNSEAIIQQYARDSGRIVRRSYSFPAIESSEVVSLAEGWRLDAIPPEFVPDCYIANPNEPSLAAGFGRREIVLNKYEKYWFKGAYSYYLAVDNNAFSKLRLYSQYAEKLLGLGITPETLYNLTPWSWLVDWVADVGNIITNATALSEDGLVIRWGYLMRHSVFSYKTTLHGLRFYNGPRGAPWALYTHERKERVKATPYGFGLNPDAFTLRQWAILAALGMTKGPRSLG
jgi:hypothetical protein